MKKPKITSRKVIGACAIGLFSYVSLPAGELFVSFFSRQINSQETLEQVVAEELPHYLSDSEIQVVPIYDRSTIPESDKFPFFVPGFYWKIDDNTYGLYAIDQTVVRHELAHIFCGRAMKDADKKRFQKFLEHIYCRTFSQPRAYLHGMKIRI